ncbi:MAG: TorF family putative porin, partial [Betaproteobacteria bacterium]
MRNALRACAAAALLSTPLFAQAQAKAEPDFTVSGNAGLFSDYRFRGFSQTGYSFAFQGGFDIAHKSGF